MQHLYLMRHGQSEANAGHIVSGSHASPLSPIGEQQATYAGQTIRQYFSIGLIVSSPMQRAVQTAQLVAAQIGYPTDKILILESLRERHLGSLEGQHYQATHHGDGNYPDAEGVAGVEPIEDLFDRTQHVLRQLRQRPEQNILVITHNGSGRMLKTAIQKLRPMDMYDQPRLENAVVYQIV